MDNFEKLFWIVEATRELRKDRGGYASASLLFDGAKSSLQILKKYNPVLLGGFAVGMYTEPRATQDFDLTVSSEDLQEALLELQKAGFVQVGFTDFKGVDLYHFERSGFKLDILQVRNKEFQKGLIERAQAHTFLDESVAVVSPEDLIVTKLLSFRPKDKIDILSLLSDTPLNMEQIKSRAQELKIFDRYAFVEENQTPNKN